MDLTFTEEQEELRKSVRRFLEQTSPEVEVRRVMDTADGYDVAVWAQMAGQLGLQSLIIPESYGGAGFTYKELAVVFEEMGRALLCSPFFSTIALATNLLLAVEDEEARKAYLPDIATGSIVATVALTEPSGLLDEEAITLTARPSGGDWQLHGEKRFVIDGHLADLILVVGRTDKGISLFAVPKGAAGLTAEPMITMDETRKQARLIFDATPATLVGEEGSGWTAVAQMLDLAAVALAAEQVGGAQRILDLAVDYAKNRYQFGRPIGGFQAIKHKCANMLLDLESAKASAYAAAESAALGDEELPLIACMAKTYCSEAYSYVAAEAIQIHGGIGFTWDHPCHLYYKRARSSEVLLGDPVHHRELLAQRMGI
jgi:alkylation response protein AidB-like acyl-CoA dehydrogenase